MVQNKEKVASGVVLLATFAIAICGLIYELIAGTVSSYLVGDSVLQFSLVIGLFMSAMGLGSFLARYINDIVKAFITVQLLLSLVGGFSAVLMFLAYGYTEHFSLVLFSLCVIIGTFIGLEIPLVIQLLGEQQSYKISVSNVLTADYIGALVAAIAFPLLLIPLLGLPQSSLLFGIINWLVALLSALFYRNRLAPRIWFYLSATILLLIAGFSTANRLVSLADAQQFQHEVILSETTPYQRITLTRSADQQRLRLFINGGLQFDSVDEYRYHESLVFPALLRHPNPKNILVLGGGDGLAIKQLLKVQSVETIDLVELDPRIVELFSSSPELQNINNQAFSSPKVRKIFQDAWLFADQIAPLTYDLIISDLPDPRNISLSKLYSKEIYRRLFSGLRADGLFVTQATSPVFSTNAFWAIADTLEASDQDMSIKPYHAYVPSFGDWGFIIAGKHISKLPRHTAPSGLRYYNVEIDEALFEFSDDINRPLSRNINSIFNHKLPAIYDAGWEKWFGN